MSALSDYITASLAPTLWYRLGETVGTSGAGSVIDATGTANGTPVSTTTFGATSLNPGDANTALTVAGAGYVEAAQTAVTGFPCSIILRAKLTSVPADTVEMILACVGKKSGLEEIWVSYVGSGGGNAFLRVVVQGAGNARIYYYTPTADTNAHTIGVVVTNSTTCALYYDGVALTINSTGGSATTPTGIDTAFVGALVYNTSNVYSPFVGDLDEVVIKAGAYSAGQMAGYHNAVGKVIAAGASTLSIAAAGTGRSAAATTAASTLAIGVSGTGRSTAQATAVSTLIIGASGTTRSLASASASSTLGFIGAGTGRSLFATAAAAAIAFSVAGGSSALAPAAGTSSVTLTVAGAGRSLARVSGSSTLSLSANAGSATSVIAVGSSSVAFSVGGVGRSTFAASGTSNVTFTVAGVGTSTTSGQTYSVFVSPVFQSRSIA